MKTRTVRLFEAYMFLDRTRREAIEIAVKLRDAGELEAYKLLSDFSDHPHELMPEIDLLMEKK